MNSYLDKLRTLGVIGNIDAKGYFIGYDYGKQQWIDENPNTPRNPEARPGSASNPLSARPVIDL